MASFQKPISPSSSSSCLVKSASPRDAAGGDEGVGLAVGLQKGGAQLGRIVRDDAKVEAVAAHAIQHGPHAVAVGVIDVAVGEGVPTGLSSSPVLKMATLSGRRTGTVAMPRRPAAASPGGEASTGSEHAGALADVFAAAANVLAGHRRG